MATRTLISDALRGGHPRARAGVGPELVWMAAIEDKALRPVVAVLRPTRSSEYGAKSAVSTDPRVPDTPAFPRRARSPQQYWRRSIMGRALPVRTPDYMTLFRSIESALAANDGRTRSALRAALFAIVPSLLMFGVLVALGIETLRAPTGTLNPAFIAYSVLLAPVIETAAMLALAAVLARLVPRHVALRIALVAFVTALAHRIGGDWRQVVDTTWPLLVYAASLVLWLRAVSKRRIHRYYDRARAIQHRLLRRRHPGGFSNERQLKPCDGHGLQVITPGIRSERPLCAKRTHVGRWPNSAHQATGGRSSRYSVQRREVLRTQNEDSVPEPSEFSARRTEIRRAYERLSFCVSERRRNSEQRATNREQLRLQPWFT